MLTVTQLNFVVPGGARLDRDTIERERRRCRRTGDQLKRAVRRRVEVPRQALLHENLAEVVAGAMRRVIGRRHVVEPHRQLARVAIAARHHR
jgi:hypothetical protein